MLHQCASRPSVILLQAHIHLLKLNLSLANIHIILALYVYDDPQEFRIPNIIISDNKKQVYAAVVHTRYNDDLNKPEIVTVLEGPCCASDFKALESLYKRSRAALQRAIVMSKNPGGFADWDDLDLS